MYGLHTAWLTKSEKKRLDGFHCRCLRRILGSRPAHYSRVSNDEVLQRSNEKPLRSYLLNHQLQLYGHVARKPSSDTLRHALLDDNSVRPAEHKGRRRRGRPRFQWNTEVHREAVRVAGSDAQLENFLQNTPEARLSWKAAVKQYVGMTA